VKTYARNVATLSMGAIATTAAFMVVGSEVMPLSPYTPEKRKRQQQAIKEIGSGVSIGEIEERHHCRITVKDGNVHIHLFNTLVDISRIQQREECQREHKEFIVLGFQTLKKHTKSPSVNQFYPFYETLCFKKGIYPRSYRRVRQIIQGGLG